MGGCAQVSEDAADFSMREASIEFVFLAIGEGCVKCAREAWPDVGCEVEGFPGAAEVGEDARRGEVARAEGVRDALCERGREVAWMGEVQGGEVCFEEGAPMCFGRGCGRREGRGRVRGSFAAVEGGACFQAESDKVEEKGVFIGRRWREAGCAGAGGGEVGRFEGDPFLFVMAEGEDKVVAQAFALN